MKPKLLVLELWGVGDLALASDFLRAACEKYSVTLVAKPHAAALNERFWPEVRAVPFVAPWTAFRGKYRLWRWPWAELRALRRQLRGEGFDAAVSARPDPRDHWVMWRASAPRRIGFARAGGGLFLTDVLTPMDRHAHRYDRWRRAAEALDLSMPAREELCRDARPTGVRRVLVHTGAAQDSRVWPLDRYAEIVKRIKAAGLEVEVLCDERQRAWWGGQEGTESTTPRSIEGLLERLEGASAFVGNDSGPGHLAALLGLPTFTVFGPVFPESYGPLHPRARWTEGEECPYKPCFDACRFPEFRCLLGVDVERVWVRLERFLEEELGGTRL